MDSFRDGPGVLPDIRSPGQPLCGSKEAGRPDAGLLELVAIVEPPQSSGQGGQRGGEAVPGGAHGHVNHHDRDAAGNTEGILSGWGVRHGNGGGPVIRERPLQP